MSRLRRLRRSVQEIWDRVPDVPCRELCQEACTIVPMSDAEEELLRCLGLEPPGYGPPPDLWCDALDADGRCSIYEHRPLVYRLFGAVPRLRCPHGCEPAGGLMTDEEGRDLLDAVDRLA